MTWSTVWPLITRPRALEATKAPDTIAALIATLEHQLDSAFVANPDPGHRTFQRLSVPGIADELLAARKRAEETQREADRKVGEVEARARGVEEAARQAVADAKRQSATLADRVQALQAELDAVRRQGHATDRAVILGLLGFVLPILAGHSLGGFQNLPRDSADDDLRHGLVHALYLGEKQVDRRTHQRSTRRWVLRDDLVKHGSWKGALEPGIKIEDATKSIPVAGKGREEMRLAAGFAQDFMLAAF